MKRYRATATVDTKGILHSRQELCLTHLPFIIALYASLLQRPGRVMQGLLARLRPKQPFSHASAFVEQALYTCKPFQDARPCDMQAL